MKRIAAIAMLTPLLTFNSYANDNLERMEEVGEQMSKLMFEAMVHDIAANGADVSKLKTLIPDTSWDQPMRDAASCMLDKYEAKIDTAGITKMLDDMEALLPKLKGGGMAALENASNMQPAGISDQEAIAINKSCGMMDLVQKNMAADGFMKEVMKMMTGY